MTEPATRRERRRAETRPGPAPASGAGPRPPLLRRIARRAVLPALAVLLLLWPLTCLIDLGETDSGELLTSLLIATAGAAPSATALALPLLTVAAQRRDWLALGLSVVAGLLPWVFVAPYASGDEPPRRPQDGTVTVMLVDAHDGRAGAVDIVAATMANAADVLVVTELSGTLAHDLTVAGLDRSVTAAWVRIPGQDGVPDHSEAGMGMWLRKGLTLTDQHPVDGTQWPALSGQVTAENGTFTVVAGHVARPSPADGRRWAQDLGALRRATEQARGPRVLLGNLNAAPWHADFRAFASSGIRDAADVLGQGPRPTWPTWSPLPILPLDHVMVAGEVGVETIHSVVIGGSDHRGLVATLRIPTG